MGGNGFVIQPNDPPGGVSTSPDLSSPAPPARPTQRLILFATLFYGAMGLLALIWRAVWLEAPLFFDSPQTQAEALLLRDFLLGGGAAVLIISLSHSLTERTRFGAELAQALARLLGPLTTSQCWLLALVSGLGEELFFRGALQPAVGLWGASLLFGLAHFVPRRALAPWAVFAALVGFLLGGLYVATGSLIAPVVTHIGVNAVNLRFLVRKYGA